MLSSVLNRSRSSSANSIRSADQAERRRTPLEPNVFVLPPEDTVVRSEIDDDAGSFVESEHEPFMEDANIAYTQKHPLGQIFLSLLKDTFNLSKKANHKEMESDLNDVCENFNKAMRLFDKSTQKQIEQATKNFEVQLIQKELNSHLINEHSDPPKRFSPVATITSVQAKNDAMRSFPTRSPKFSGMPVNQGGIDIVEFISALNTAQEYCNLSEKEFKQMLLLCTTGRAHTLVAEWIRLEESVPTIYHNLLTNFDKRMTPQTAQELLFNYKAPKSTSLRDVETNLMLWASRAATSLPEGPARKAFYNMQIIQALVRSLPPQSSARVQSVYNTLSARLGRTATATELSKALNLDRHSIDTDIKQHGTDSRHLNSSTGNTNKFLAQKGYRNSGGVSTKRKMRNSARMTFSVTAAQPIQEAPRSRYDRHHTANGARYVQRRETARTYSGNIYHNNDGQQNYSGNKMNGRLNRSRSFNRSSSTGVRNYRSSSSRGRDSSARRTFMNSYDNKKAPNKRFQSSNRQSFGQNYCSLCGKRDHRASHGCPYMVTDAGARVNIMPTHTLCDACPQFVKPRLNHPSMMCPYRKGGPLSQRS